MTWAGSGEALGRWSLRVQEVVRRGEGMSIPGRWKGQDRGQKRGTGGSELERCSCSLGGLGQTGPGLPPPRLGGQLPGKEVTLALTRTHWSGWGEGPGS